MGYKVYYKNTLTKKQSPAWTTHGKYEQYDRKTYATEAQAKASLKRHKKSSLSLQRKYKFRITGEKYEVRKTKASPSEPTRKRRDPYADFGFL